MTILLVLITEMIPFTYSENKMGVIVYPWQRFRTLATQAFCFFTINKRVLQVGNCTIQTIFIAFSFYSFVTRGIWKVFLGSIVLDDMEFLLVSLKLGR